MPSFDDFGDDNYSKLGQHDVSYPFNPDSYCTLFNPALTTKASGADVTVVGVAFDTDSVSFSNNRLYLLTVQLVRAAGTVPTVTGVTGGGLTWVQVAAVSQDSILRVEVWRAMVSSGATTASIHITGSGAAAPDDAFYSIVEGVGFKTTGTNGSDAVVQSGTNGVTSATSLAVTLAAFADITYNMAFGSFMCQNPEAQSTDTSYGYLDTNSGTISSVIVERFMGQDTSVAESSATAARRAGVALELAWDGVSPTPPPTNHTYIIRHVKIVNRLAISNQVKVYKDTGADASRLIFGGYIPSQGLAEFNGIWVVGSGSNLVAASSNLNSAHIIVYGLDLTT